MDVQEQLELLRRKIARIDRKYADGPPPSPQPLPSPELPAFVNEVLSGEVVSTAAGQHFETERVWERHRRHGSMDVLDLQQLPQDLLGVISAGECSPCPVERWAFLDTETTGLAGGSGTYAFLIGIGHITAEGFRVRQFFMRDYGEEASQLHAVSEYLSNFDVLVTYNGKTFDQPLLETRFRMCRMRPPFPRLQHLDLLHGARRLWKLRLESCRLVDLENQILGVEREGDLPGEMIPYVYFEYVRTRQAFRLIPIFHHNATDILTTACLAAIVPFAFRDPGSVLHGADLVGLARWLVAQAAQKPVPADSEAPAAIDGAGEAQAAEGEDPREQAARLLRRAIDLGLPDALLFRTMWDLAGLERRLGRNEAGLALLADLAACRNGYRVLALEALSKHYEHREKQYSVALEMVRKARELEDSRELAHREERLERRIRNSRARTAGELPLAIDPEASGVL